jgi:small GTP-binding protein
LTRNFFQNSDGAIVVYDVSNRTSFYMVKEWIESVLNNSGENVKIALVGNKIDLEREVTYNEGQEFAMSNKMLYFETSAKENIGIDEMIRKFTLEVIEVKSRIFPEDVLNIENRKYKKNKCYKC